MTAGFGSSSASHSRTVDLPKGFPKVLPDFSPQAATGERAERIRMRYGDQPKSKGRSKLVAYRV